MLWYSLHLLRRACTHEYHDLELDSERLQVLVIRDVGIYSLPDSFGSLLAILLLPLAVLDFHSLGFLFLAETWSARLSIRGGVGSQSSKLTCAALLGLSDVLLMASSWNPFHFSKASFARWWDSSVSQMSISGLYSIPTSLQ